MNILRRHLPGFKGSDAFTDAQFNTLFWKRISEKRAVVFVSNLTPQRVGYWKLSYADYRLFIKGKLGLVPPGCCSPGSFLSGRKQYESATVVFTGQFKSVRHVLGLIEQVMEQL